MNTRYAETHALAANDALAAHDARTARSNSDEIVLGHMAAKGAGIGFGVGGFIGAVIAALAAAVTSIALPGFGILMAGPIAAAIIGAGAGAANGTLVGALIGWSIPEEHVVPARVAAAFPISGDRVVTRLVAHAA